MTTTRGMGVRVLALLSGWLLAAWVVTALAPVAQAQVPEVEIVAPVNDLAQVLSGATEKAITRKLTAHRKRTGVQMAVVTVRTTGGVPISDFSLKLATRWGGGSKERDDGVLLVPAINDRTMRLEVGYGLEPAIPDSTARAILDSSRSQLRSSDYDGAVSAMVDQVVRRTEHVLPGRRAKPYAEPLGSLVAVIYPLVLLLGILAGWLARRTIPVRSVDAKAKKKPPPPTAGTLALRWGWVGLLPLAAAITYNGGYHWAYALVVGLGVAIGAVCQGGVEKSLAWVVSFLIALAALYFVGLAMFVQRLLAPLDVAVLLFQHLLWSFAGMVVLRGLAAMEFGGGGGSSTYSSSSWSSGSSSWSSSSSSSSWSGGGGSFGGGGASSSW